MSEFFAGLTKYPEAATAIAAVLALIIASGSLIATLVTIAIQRRHNRKSVIPVAEFILGDYEDTTKVALTNKGLGPMIVKELAVSDGKKHSSNLISIMPEHPTDIPWADFTGNITDRCLSPGETVNILLLSGNGEDSRFRKFRDDVRRKLGTLKISVTFENVYSERLPRKSRSLDWFHRNLPQDDA